ncbi:MAG TPA: hypothetical protein V6C90_07140 [Coleofasciculaceae cyanobacterium]|jgi:hypothetical protein
MSEEKPSPSQSFSISGGQLSGVNIGGIAGSNLTANQQISQGESEKQLSSADVVELIAQIEELFQNSDLPEAQKEKVIKHLQAAKEEATETEPDKDYALKSFQRAAKALKEANETVSAGQGLWQKLEPIVIQLAPWFGVAAKSLLWM